MHPSVSRAIQEIDAAVYNGDTFEEPTARAELLAYAEAWVRKLKEPILEVEEESENVPPYT
jgi:hypothetical protein